MHDPCQKVPRKNMAQKTKRSNQWLQSYPIDTFLIGYFEKENAYLAKYTRKMCKITQTCNRRV